MFVERPCEVDIEKLLMVDGQPHHPTSKPEVAQVIRIDVRQTVRLKCCTYDNKFNNNIPFILASSMMHVILC